jgi:hypothetical protein
MAAAGKVRWKQPPQTCGPSRDGSGRGDDHYCDVLLSIIFILVLVVLLSGPDFIVIRRPFLFMQVFEHITTLTFYGR